MAISLGIGRPARRGGGRAGGLVGVGLHDGRRVARGVQRLRLRAGPPAGVDRRHLRLRQPGDRGGARGARGGGAVLRAPAHRRRCRAGRGRGGGAAERPRPGPRRRRGGRCRPLPRPAETVGGYWQHRPRDRPAAAPVEVIGARRGPPGGARRTGLRRAATGGHRSPVGTSCARWTGSGCSSSTRSTLRCGRTTCRCSAGSAATTGRWSTTPHGRTRCAGRGCWSSTGRTRRACCRCTTGRCYARTPSPTGGGGTTRTLIDQHPGLVDDVLAAVKELGPVGAGELEAVLGGPTRRRPPGRSWWERSDIKRICEYLFGIGRAHHRGPPALPAALRPARAGAATRRARHSHTARGRGGPRAHPACRVGARRRHRAGPARLLPHRARQHSRRAVAELVESGELEPVEVRGWRHLAYRVPGVPVPAADHRSGAAVPVRSADLGAGPHRADLRLPLPDRDLRAGAEAGVRVLRVPVPAGR